MIQTHTTTDPQPILKGLVDAEYVGDLLRDGLGLAWPAGSLLSDVSIERVWPLRAGGFSFEWSFALGIGARGTLYGTLGAQTSDDAMSVSLRPVLTPYGVRRVYVLVPEWELLVHSSDVDPRLPQLTDCLDGEGMVRELRAAGLASEGRATNGAARAACRVLSYRPGRRATVQYDFRGRSGAPCRVLGKTYRDDRGADLLRRHAQLNDRLAAAVGRRVSVPKPLVYLDDVRMAVYAWAPGQPVDDETAATQAHTRRAADALVALHGLVFDDLSTYTPHDECDVVVRWQLALGLLDPSIADRSRPIVEALAATSEHLEPMSACTLHRDFYESQLLISPTSTTVLDIDTLCSGDRCADLGNLLAHQYLAFLRRTNLGTSFHAVVRCLLQRYESGAEPVSRVNLKFYFAAALFRVGAVHALRTATGRFVPELWRLSGRLMDTTPTESPTVCGRSAASLAANLDLILGALR